MGHLWYTATCEGASMDSAAFRRLQVASARADLLAGAVNTVTDVRQVIAASWRRSIAVGIDPATATADYQDDLALESRLVQAARPIIDRVADETSDLALSIGLTDAQSRLLLRIDTESRIGRLLDHVQFAPGYNYGEDVMGTNGVGTALASGQAVEVHGPEHFSERLQAFSCTGAPIRDPVTGQLEGVLDVTCLFEDSTPLLRSLVRNAISEIERNILLDRGVNQHAVFDAYMRATLRGRGAAIGAVGLSMLLSNQTMHESFTEAQKDVLRSYARFLSEQREVAEELVPLQEGGSVLLRTRRIDVGGQLVGVVFEARPQLSERDSGRQGSAGGCPTQEPASLEESPERARTVAWRRAFEELCAAMQEHSTVLAVGERGTGRVTALGRAFDSMRPGAVRLVLDAARPGASGKLSEALSGAKDPLLVVLRDIGATPADEVAELVRVLREHRDDAKLTTFAGTLTTGDGAHKAAPELLELFAGCAVLPPLRHRVPDLPVIAAQIVHELAPDRRLAEDTLRALSRYDWPGNLTQLRVVLQAALARRPVGEILAGDLPPELFAAHRSSAGTLESAERDAIVQALREHDGNRVRAAAQLNISRATLYRKLQQYRITI